MALVILVTLLYDRLGSREFIWTLSAACATCLVLFSISFQIREAQHLYDMGLLPVRRRLVDNLWVATFWAYLNELTAPEQSKRLYGIMSGPEAWWRVGGKPQSCDLLVEERGASPLLAACVAVPAVMALIVQRVGVLGAALQTGISQTRYGQFGSPKE